MNELIRDELSKETKADSGLTVSKTAAMKLLRTQIEKGRKIIDQAIESWMDFNRIVNEYHEWDAYNCEVLNTIFTTNQQSKEYSNWTGGVESTCHELSIDEQSDDLRKEIVHQVHRLESVVERLGFVHLSSQLM